MGLATLADEVDAVKQIYEFQERTGFKLGSMLHIPSGNVAPAERIQENAPKTTSFMLESLEDWMALRNAAPIDISLNDHHLVLPEFYRDDGKCTESRGGPGRFFRTVPVGLPGIHRRCEALFGYGHFPRDHGKQTG